MKIGIYGAGAIGCYLGGRLAAAGSDVTFLCRPSMYDKLSQSGLKLTDYKNYQAYITPKQLRLTTNPQDLCHLEMIFICVKSAATEQVAHELKQLFHQTLVDSSNSISNLHKPVLISFQNSVSNVPLLKSVLNEHMILEGMVPFNVAEQASGHFHQGTEGALYVKVFDDQSTLKRMFKKAKLEIQFSQDMQAVQWAKVLLNLNNPINALSKLPLKQQLSNREYRQCLAMAQNEALDLLELAEIKPAQLTVIPAQMIPYVLNLPNFLFKLLSRKMLTIDPLARSSMQDDLMAGKTTEIDWINGEVLRLAMRLGKKAPINLCLLALIKDAEKNKSNVEITGHDLKRRLSQQV